jgi:polyhydroxybutyrate depolymerase
MKLKKILYAFLIFFCISQNCAVFAQTSLSKSFVFEGLTRNYRIYIPAIYNSNTAVPLLFNLHGYTSNNVEQELYADFRPIADTANFIIILPNGTPDAGGSLTWNNFGLSQVNDLGFINALIDTAASNYNIDLNRVYSTGMSNGGFMSYDLACQLSNRIAAIASVTGTMLTSKLNACNPSRVMPIMQIHGTADGTVPYLGNIAFAPIETLVQTWVQKNNCNSSPIQTEVPDINTTDLTTATHFLYTGGTNGNTVEFYKINGGGHSWPGAPININITNMDFSACKEIWRFFSQYSLNGTASIAELKEVSPLAFPNPSNNIFSINLKETSPTNVQIYNQIGQIVNEYKNQTGLFSFKLPSNGMFYLVLNGDKTSAQKIIQLP